MAKKRQMRKRSKRNKIIKRSTQRQRGNKEP
jgi:hypothetical protein